MRNLSMCISCLAIVVLTMPFSFGQPTNGVASNNTFIYEQVVYQEFQHGVVVNPDGVLQGVLVRDVNGVGEPIPGVKLTIIGGDDFVFTVETDENGEFSFEGAEVGSYSVILDENGVLSSLDFKVTNIEPNMQILGPNTGVNGVLKLVVDENGNLRFAATRGSLPLPQPVNAAATTAAAPAAATPAAAAGAGGGLAGGAAAGGFGGMAGALGIAGLVGGITALATNNSSNTDNTSKAVSAGTPSSK